MDDALHITKTTFRVADFLAWQRHGALDLRPPFQRGSVWTKPAKSLFVDSLINGYPIPLIFLKDETDPTTFEPKRLVVDGQQRLRTVIAFIDSDSLTDTEESDSFTVSRTHNPTKEIAGRPFKKLPKEYQDRILNFELAVHILPPATPPRLLLDMFARLNSTGAKLNEQEIRNAEFTGAFRTEAYRISYDQLDRWLTWKIFAPRAIARMQDVELTSELMMLTESGVRGKSQAAITKFYEDYEYEFPHSEKVYERVSTVLDQIEEVSEALPKGLADTKYRTQSWFYALFEVIHSRLYRSRLPSGPNQKRKFDSNSFAKNLLKKNVLLQAGELTGDLAKALRGAAADRSSRQTRVDFLLDA